MGCCGDCKERQDSNPDACGYFDYAMDWVLECDCACHIEEGAE